MDRIGFCMALAAAKLIGIINPIHRLECHIKTVIYLPS